MTKIQFIVFLFCIVGLWAALAIPIVLLFNEAKEWGKREDPWKLTLKTGLVFFISWAVNSLVYWFQ
jgi:hypothetical protein